MVTTGEPPVVSALARRAGVSRRFVCDHPELRAEVARRASQVADRYTSTIAASARTTAASLRADVENAKADKRRLEMELSALRRRLGELTGKEVLADVEKAPGAAANARVAELEHVLFDVQEALARTTEELGAARQINRELMGRVNRRR